MTKFKKLLTWLICSLLIGGILPNQGIFAASDWQPRGDVSLRMGVVADSHINTAEHKILFENALDAFAAIDANYDGIAMVGDIVYQYKSAVDANPSDSDAAKEYLVTEGYDMLNDALSKHAPGKEFIYDMGNHEFPLNGKNELITQESKKLFTEKTNQQTSVDKLFNGFHFITAEPVNYSNVMSTENELWMQERIDAAIAENADKPVFLLLHQPIQDTVIGSGSYQYYSENFISYLKSKPQVIVLSAHTHYPTQDPNTIWQDGFTAVGLSMIGGGYLSTPGKHIGNISDSSQAMLLEIDANNVVSFYRMDLLSGNFIGKPWVMDIPKMVAGDADAWKYTAKRKGESATPTFPVGAQLETSNVTVDETTITFPQGTNEERNDDGFVISYRIQVISKKLQQLVQDYQITSDYYLSERAAKMSTVIENLAQDTDYLIRVSAVSPFGSESVPLTTEIRTQKQTQPSVSVEDKREKIIKYVGECTSTTVTRKWGDGTGAAGYGFYEKENNITFEFDVETAGKYELLVTVASGSEGSMSTKVSLHEEKALTIPAGDFNTKGIVSGGYYFLPTGKCTVTLEMLEQAASSIHMWSVELAKEEDAVVVVAEAKDYTNSTITNGHSNEISYNGHLVFWGNSTIKFNMDIPMDGNYEVYVDSGASGEGSKWSVSAGGGATPSEEWPNTGSYANHIRKKLGVLSLKQGKQEVSATLNYNATTSFRRLLLVQEGVVPLQEIETSTEDAFLTTGDAISGVSGSVNFYGKGYGTTFRNAYISIAITPKVSGYYDIGLKFASSGTKACVYVNEKLLSEADYIGGNPSGTDRVRQSAGKLGLKQGETYIIKIVECGENSLNVERLVLAYQRELTMEDKFFFDAFVGDRIATNLPESQQYGDGKTTTGYSFGEAKYVDYDVVIEQAGEYMTELVIGSTDGANASIYVNGTCAATKDIPSGDFFTKEVHELGSVFLQEGKQRLRVAGNSGGAQLWALRLTAVRAAVDSDSYTQVRLANSYDRVSENNQYFTSQDEGVVLGHEDNWVEYDIKVSAGNYALVIEASTTQENAESLLSVNGTLLGCFRIPKNDQYLSGYQTVSLGVVSLEEGINTFRLKRGANWFTYGSIKLERIAEPISELYSGDYIVAGQQLIAPVSGTMTLRTYLPANMSGKNLRMLAAVYSGQTLCGFAQTESVTAGVNTVVIVQLDSVAEMQNGDYTCKIFYWDGAGTMQPLCKATNY